MIAFGEEFMPQLAHRKLARRPSAKSVTNQSIASPAVLTDTPKRAVVVFDQKDVEKFVAVAAGVVVAQKLGADDSRHIC